MGGEGEAIRAGWRGEDLAGQAFAGHYDGLCFILGAAESHWQTGIERRQDPTLLLKASPSSCCVKIKL